jgi:hypothetical protein
MNHIFFDKVGKITQGNHKNWFIEIKDDTKKSGGYYVLLCKTSSFDNEVFDNWLENHEDLKQYFSEKEWVMAIKSEILEILEKAKRDQLKLDKYKLNKLLLQILDGKEPYKQELIEKYQNFIRIEKIIGVTEKEMDIYITLACDLDFYEPNEDWRKEDEAYYDENRLITEIKEALKKLKTIEKNA